jgi:hypothetical protein
VLSDPADAELPNRNDESAEARERPDDPDDEGHFA